QLGRAVEQGSQKIGQRKKGIVGRARKPFMWGKRDQPGVPVPKGWIWRRVRMRFPDGRLHQDTVIEARECTFSTAEWWSYVLFAQRCVDPIDEMEGVVVKAGPDMQSMFFRPVPGLGVAAYRSLSAQAPADRVDGDVEQLVVGIELSQLEGGAQRCDPSPQNCDFLLRHGVIPSSSAVRALAPDVAQA